MEMHQVRYFLAVAENLNFTRAAEQCHVAQPSLTSAIKKLEAELEGDLFHRERKRTHLTELGRLMLPHMQRINETAAAARADAAAFLVLENPTVHLGVMSTIAARQMIDFVAALNKALPNLTLKIREAAGDDLATDLLNGEIDIAILASPELPDNLRTIDLYCERYTVAFAGGHRFELLNEVPITELNGEDYVVRLHCEFTDYFEALGVKEGFESNVRYSTEREDWAQAMVLAGMGCSIIPEFGLQMPGIVTRPVSAPTVSRTVSLVTVAGRRHTPAISAFVQMAQRHDWPGHRPQA